MFRPFLITPPGTSHSQNRIQVQPLSWQDIWARLLPPVTLWLCVSVCLRYGYYGDSRMVVGPSSSRLMKASSVFVQQVEVRDYGNKKGALLYGFSEKPELIGETNWTASKFLIVASYSAKGFSLWLNKGSRIHMRLESQSSNLDEVQVAIIKGQRKSETLQPETTSSSEPLDPTRLTHGNGFKHTIDEDNKYYVNIINMNHRNIIMSMKLNVTSKLYDLKKTKKICSTSNGFCRLKLEFPNSQYVLLTTPDNGDLNPWSIELSFVARLVTYIAILGFMIIVIFMVFKYMGTCENDYDRTNTTSREVTETDPIIPEKSVRFTYGTNNGEEDAVSSGSSSEDLYDAKLCVICYDEQRNCFFVPCGHCATCYDCAQRIMEGEGKMCPICRRLIHKVKRLFTA